MIPKNAPFFSFNLLIFLQVSKLLCHPQKLIQTPQSTEDSFTNASQSKVCHGCRKLFSYDPSTTELSDEEFINTEATTLLGDIVNADVKIVDGNQDSYAISNSTSAEALVSTQAWNNFDANDLKERSREGLEGTMATNSEMFGDSGGKNSVTGAFTLLSEDSRRMMLTSHTSLDISQPEDSMNERNKEDLEETRATNSEKIGDSGDTNSVTGPLPQKGEMGDESHLVKPDRIGSSDPKNFELSESAMSLYPKKTNAELEVNNLKPYAYTGRSEADHESLSNVFANEPHQASAMSLSPERTNAELKANNLKPYAYAESLETDHEPLRYVNAQVTNAEGQTSLLSNFEEAGGNGVKSLQFNQPIKIRGETSEIIDEATQKTALNRNINETFGISSSSIESLPTPLQNTDNLPENKDVANSKNTIWTSAWNRKYPNFPEKIHPKVEEPKVLRQVNDEWDAENEKSDFPATDRDIKSSRENLEVSESSDSTTELPPVITNVNGVVLEDPTKRLKSNKSLNLLQSSQAGKISNF
ncbi:hypothetical protein AVEN_52019-1 [Araneus ventricosus]|uniref:Uncharacterized protein n=1 Tax=Araneus ventricosus TaxID=182803 RepID=A0A4Y2CF41_ARAVE|nr:hypothetical protein AVEN_52019-1 [Araneus ventricosus]